MNRIIYPAVSLIVPLLFLYKDGFDIKYPTKIDMQLIKETEIDIHVRILKRVSKKKYSYIFE